MGDEEDIVDAILAIAAGIAIGAAVGVLLKKLQEQNDSKKGGINR